MQAAIVLFQRQNVVVQFLRLLGTQRIRSCDIVFIIFRRNRFFLRPSHSAAAECDEQLVNDRAREHDAMVLLVMIFMEMLWCFTWTRSTPLNAIATSAACENRR